MLTSASAQNRFMLGINGGANISRLNGNDTFANNFSRRNRLGGAAGINMSYDLSSSSSITLAVNYINKGYKINNDTLPTNTSLVRSMNTINIPLGISFRQQFNSSNYIMEKFGVIGNFTFRNDSTITTNRGTTPYFRAVEVSQNNFYPMFYLGFGIGGTAESGDRYEINITYSQSFSNDALIRVEYGSDYKKNFVQNYRGGFLQIGLTYYFNLSNFKKSEDYFYD